MRSDMRTTSASTLPRGSPVVWLSMPSLVSAQRLSPRPSFSRRSTHAQALLIVRKPPGYMSASALSPAWPKGVCPRSCPRAMASVRSSLRRSAREMVRAMRATSRVWVSRVR